MFVHDVRDIESSQAFCSRHRSQLGRSGYDVDLMLRVLLPDQWHSLSDRKLDTSINV